MDKNEVKIDPRSSSTVTAKVNAPCDEEGTKTFTLNIESKASKAIVSVDSTVKINNCFDFIATPSKESVDMCEHTKQEILLLINNLADADNSYSLSLIGPAWANLDKEELPVKSKSKGQANLVLTPDYGVEGDFKIEINIESKEGGVKKKKIVEVKVNKCNSASIDIVKPTETVCQSSSKTTPLLIKNTGEFNKTFELSSDTDWVKVSNTKVDVEQGDEKEVELILSPAKETVTGKYPVKIKMTALDDSSIVEEDAIEVEVITLEKCYKPSIKIEKKIEVAKEDAITSDIVIENKGEVAADYEITITGTASEFIHLNPNTTTLNPKATEIMQLYIAPTIRTEPGTYLATISVKEKNSSILDEKSITIEVEDSKGDNVKGEDKATRAVSSDLIDFKKEKIITGYTEFILKGEKHKIEIEEVNENSVTIKISSDPIFVVLNASETREVDIDDDGINDLKVSLESIKEGEPRIKVQEINQNEINNESFFSRYRNWIIGAIIVIILIILASIFFSDDGEDISEEKEKEEEGKIRIGRYILVLFIIGIIYWLSKKYPLFSYLTTYKLYIIAGIIILIILILIIKYWDNIIKFFEEEETEEEIKEKVKETIEKEEEKVEDKEPKKAVSKKKAKK